MYGIEDLRTFVAIAEAHGVTAGARRVGISPATASHRLGKLEASLRLTLFHRNSRTMRLTDEGRIFFERTRTILSDLARAERDAGSGTARLVGHLRATMSPWVLSRFILPTLPAFQEQHPELTFEFLAVDRFVSLSSEGQDCAVRVGRLQDSALVARKLCSNERIVCASPEFVTRHGIGSGSDRLAALPWICLPWQTRIAFRDAKDRRRDASITPSVRVSNSDMLTEAAVRGLGLAIKSRLAITNELEDGRLIEVAPGTLYDADAPISFVFPPETRSAEKTRAFGEFLSTCFERRVGAD